MEEWLDHCAHVGVSSGTTGSIQFSPLLFQVSVNDMSDGTCCALRKCGSKRGSDEHAGGLRYCSEILQ